MDRQMDRRFSFRQPDARAAEALPGTSRLALASLVFGVAFIALGFVLSTPGMAG